MRQNGPIKVLLLTIITFGIYGIVWYVKTKNDMNKLGANIPTAWLLIVPFVSIWWMWKYSEGVELVTKGKISTILAFVLLFLLGGLAFPILQFEFNKVGSADATPVAGDPSAFAPQTDGTFGAPTPAFQPPAPQTVMPATPQVIEPTPMPVASVEQPQPYAAPQPVSPEAQQPSDQNNRPIIQG